MNGALLRKELRELLPWGILAIALAVSEIAALLLDQIDMLPLGQTAGMLNDEFAILYWFVAFALGTGLTIREHDDGTVHFLDGLPVSRTRVFLVKCAVMFGLVLLAPVVRVAAMLLLHQLSRGSLDHDWHVMLIAQGFGLQALLLANGLMLGAALGRLRSLTWLVTGVAAVALLILVQRVPHTASLNPMALLSWQWSVTGLRVDSQAVLIQLLVACAALLIAWHGFVHGGRARRWANIMQRPFAGAAVTLASIGAGIAVLILIAPAAAPPPQETQSGGGVAYVFGEGPPAQTVTDHFRFSYPAHESAAALALAEQADAIFEEVHALLGVPLGERIDVDASGSLRNTHGTAFFDRIRIRLDSEVRPVLAHEAAHVVARRLAGGAEDRLWREADVLNEGLASWVEAHFRAPSARADERMLALAALHTRRELLMDELASPSRLRAARDEGLMYAAGEALIGAIIRLYGEAALPRLLEAFADPGLPADLRGMRLWQATFQLAGMDVAAVVDEFYREVSAYAEAHAHRIAALPRPRVMLVRRGGAFGVRTLVDEPVGATSPTRVMLRFRPAPDSPLTAITAAQATAGEVHWLTPQRIAGGRVCVQPGASIGTETLFERWECLPLSDAVEL